MSFHCFLKSLCDCFTNEKMEAERSSEDLSLKLQASLSNYHLTSPLGCLIGLSNLHPKLSACDASLQSALPTEILISVMVPSFQLLRALESSLTVLFLSHLICHKILLALPSKYIQNLTMSHHLHCYHSGLSSHQLFLGLLEQPSN